MRPLQAVEAKRITDRIFHEWNAQKNVLLGYNSPLDSLTSKVRLHWRCLEHGHEFREYLSFRANFSEGCPYCSDVYLLNGFNDLGSKAGFDLLDEWHPTRNGVKKPKDFLYNSKSFAYWKCYEHGHEWRAKIKNRFYNDKGCPVCSGDRLLVGFNDVASVRDFEHLTTEWHPTKNHKLTPENTPWNSSGTFWWSCLENHSHEWSSSIKHRLQGGQCLICLSEKNKEEMNRALVSETGFNFIQMEFPETSQKSTIHVDYYSEELGLAISFDDEFSHRARDKNGNLDETIMASDSVASINLILKGYKVIRIREHALEGKLPSLPFARSPIFKQIGTAHPSQVKEHYLELNCKTFGKDKSDMVELVRAIMKKKSQWFI